MAKILTSTDFQAGCPVLAVSVEDGEAEVREAAAEVFRGWESLLAESLREHGVAPEQVPQLATLVVAAAEGAVAMCRAQRTTKPLEAVATQLESMITTAIHS